MKEKNLKQISSKLYAVDYLHATNTPFGMAQNRAGEQFSSPALNYTQVFSCKWP